MQNQIELSVVVPVYNEEKRLEALLHDWAACFRSLQIRHRFVLINDGSKDNSLNVIRQAMADYPVELIQQANQGHGPAILNGYQHSRDTDWIFQIDSDHQLEPTTFPLLWQQRHQHDLLLGSRVVRHASLARRILSAITFRLVGLLYGRTISDINIPYRLVSRSLLQSYLPHTGRQAFAPNVLMTAFALYKKYSVYIAPVQLREQADDRKSRLSWYIFKGAVKSLVELARFKSTIA